MTHTEICAMVQRRDYQDDDPVTDAELTEVLWALLGRAPDDEDRE